MILSGKMFAAFLLFVHIVDPQFMKEIKNGILYFVLNKKSIYVCINFYRDIR